MICDPNPAFNLTGGSEFFEDEFFGEIERISMLDFMDFRKCEFLGDSYKCRNIFKPIMTNEGVCLTFNMVDRADIFRSNV